MKDQEKYSLKLFNVCFDIKFGFLLVLILGSTFLSFAQTSNKKRVLVIPPNRFEFVSEFSLEEIARINETKTAEVFISYEKTLLSSFKNYEDENFKFVPVDALGLSPYKRLFKSKYGKFKGKQYNAVNLKNFSEANFMKLLTAYKADFVIFINWYDIQKEAFRRRGAEHVKRQKYAGHYMDYDIYDLFKQHIIGVGRVKAEGAVPTDLELSFKLLRTQELKFAYQNFISEIVDQLNKPIEE